MTIKYKNPYGDYSFENFNKENAAFVDKTGFIEVIDNLDTKYPVLLRPRRFGKSTFVQMLDYFYDIAKKDQYDEVFRGTKIHEMNLPSHNSYHVISFEFSEIFGNTSQELIKKFSSNILGSIRDFRTRYKDFEFDIESRKNDSPSTIIDEFFSIYGEYSNNTKDLYILIDEYDNFANEILSKDRKLFKAITNADGFLKAFYKAIKKHTKKVVAKTFITGVSSVSLDSLTSGFNIAKNVTCDPRLNEFAGFTKDELIGLIEKLVDTKALNTTADTIAEIMRQAYNGYAFCPEAKHTLFNSSMCLNYIDYISLKKTIENPERVLDPACAFDKSKVADIISFTPKNVLKLEASEFETTGEIVISELAQSINLNQLDRYDLQTSLSVLYYLGYLTIKNDGDGSRICLTYPNKMMKYMFELCFINALIPKLEDDENCIFDITSMLRGDTSLDGFIDSVTEYLSLRITNQHLLGFNENTIKVLVRAKLEDLKMLSVNTEQKLTVPMVGEKFADLVVDNRKGTYYLFEFKYFSKAKAQQHPNILQEKIDEATEQINCYKKAVEFEGKTLYSYIAIFESINCVHFEKV
ncbi:MAG: AAA family ATPase [Succinivibrio sp.]|nr:AAA family ATPase [Succinivibrio sp.]